MDSFRSYLQRDLYKAVEKLGDRLAEAEPLIDWDAFRPIVAGLYTNDGPPGGRPSIDPVVMVKMLVLQQWYGLSDPELERQATDRISFRRFLGYPETLPGEVAYRDEGYQGAVLRGYDATMKRASRGHPLSIWDRLRNKRISRKRCPGERPFAVIKRVFGSGYVLVTTVSRVRVKMVFSCFCFILVQLGRLGVG